MPNNKNNNQQPLSNNADLLQDMRDLFSANDDDYSALTKAVKDLTATIKSTGDPRKTSQSIFNDRRNEMEYSRNSRARRASEYRHTGSILGDIEEGIKDQMLDSLAGGDFKKGMQSALSEFTKRFGFELKDLPHEYGKHLGSKLFDSIKSSKLGSDVTKSLEKGISKYLDKIGGSGTGSSLVSAFKSGSGSMASSGGGKLGTQIAGGAMSQGANYQQLMSGLDKVAGKAGVIGAVVAVLYLLLKPALTGLGDFLKKWVNAWSKDEDMRKKRLENAQKRVEADLEYLAREPFEILMKATKEWYDEWDKNLSKISLTQGYTKEDVYDLYSSMSSRLIEEGLEKVIPATDVIEKLSSILDTGLSGQLAEAFAYEATKLNAAIPGQDFTSYASIYAQLASEAVSYGATQAEAIDYANEQLELFASNLLYSSRTLTGGFTTGLKNAESLFSSAVNIAQTARTSNAAQISGTLTSVAAVIGAIAPDLASGLVENVVNAAIGGNSDTIVALRSLAGINAGNTEFLNALATNPQAVFVNIFRSLSAMQNMSPTNYMEVAEGLSSVFGVDMKALARVDFNNLANAVADMSINANSLNENMALLASGEATTTTEQLKLQEINNVILEEGLAYVIDSEAGRMVQEHMWQEQIANELANNQYAVDLTGASLALIEGLRHSVANILNFLNPIAYLAKGVSNLSKVNAQTKNVNADLQTILTAGAVGSNYTALSNLLTTGTDLGLVKPLAELMVGSSANSSYWSTTDVINNNPLSWALGKIFGTDVAKYNPTNYVSGDFFNYLVDSGGGSAAFASRHDMGYRNSIPYSGLGGNASYGSLYSGFTVGKSALNHSAAFTLLPAVVRQVTAGATQAALAASNKQMEAYLAAAEEFAKTGTWNDYLAAARDFGIADAEAVFEEYGGTEAVRNYFEQQQGRAGALKENEWRTNQENFLAENRRFWDYANGTNGLFNTSIWSPFVKDEFKPFFDNEGRFDKRIDAIDAALAGINTRLGDPKEFTVISALSLLNQNIKATFVDTSSTFQQCLADWIRYIAASKKYSETTSTAAAWNELKQAEGDAKNETLLALANAMKAFTEDELKTMDPQLQTNVLLGKIVIILEAIMQQNNSQVGGLSLIDSINALALGMTTTST